MNYVIREELVSNFSINKNYIIQYYIMSIQIENYPTLSTYTVLANKPIASANKTTITNGYFGSSEIPTLDTSNLQPASNLQNSPNAITALSELTEFIGDINAIIPQTDITTITPITGEQRYTPGSYRSSSSMVYDTDSSITFDAEGDNNAQFFIISDSSIIFSNVLSIHLLNGATNRNVFWLANTDITFTGSLPSIIPGIFIAYNSISILNNSNILGRLFAENNDIVFSGISFVDSV
jgi:hypothetical protein